MGEITSIVYKPADLPDKPADHYTRVPLTQARLVAGYGIEGDRKGGHPKRQLNLMCADVLAELAEAGFQVAPGQMGEQIMVRGVDLAALAVGDRLRIGAEAEIEVTDQRTGCDRFETLQGKKRSEAAGQMGVMARVITGGAIQIGDRVQVL